VVREQRGFVQPLKPTLLAEVKVHHLYFLQLVLLEAVVVEGLR
jgi:hypothetical protein